MQTRKYSRTLDINKDSAYKLPPINNTNEILFKIAEMQRCR